MLNLPLFFVPREPQTTGKPHHMRIRSDSLVLMERRIENDGGRFASNARQMRKFFHGTGDAAVMFGKENLAQLLNVLGLRMKRAAGMNEFFQLLARNSDVLLWLPEAPEERLGDNIHTHISALRGEDGGHEEIQWCLPIQERTRRMIEPLEGLKNFR